ncbi:MAG: doubled motif LPXTG anchor domain-containing protein [Clostridium sp.]
MSDEESETDAPTASGTIGGKSYNKVVVDDSYYARAFVTTLDQLHIAVTTEGHVVSYNITPVGTARVKGPEGIADGQDLTFTVKPQVDYTVESVMANGVTLTAEETDGATSSDASSSSLRYVIPTVTEDQEIIVQMAELGEHPKFDETVTMADGMKIRITAAEGILPAGTTIEVKEVTAQVEEAVKEKVEADTAGTENAKEVVFVIAYDIKLCKDGAYLDNSWSDNGYVTVTFSGDRIAQSSTEADTISVMYIDTDADIEETITEADINSVESVAEPIDVSGGNAVSEASFEAGHFSPYMVYGIKNHGIKPAYFYLLRPKMSQSETGNNAFLYIGKGSIEDFGDGSYKSYDFNKNENHIKERPSDTEIKTAIQTLYGDPSLKYQLTYYRIPYTNGWVDAAGKPGIPGGNCYHVDGFLQTSSDTKCTCTFIVRDIDGAYNEPVYNNSDITIDTQFPTLKFSSKEMKDYPQYKNNEDGKKFVFEGWYKGKTAEDAYKTELITPGSKVKITESTTFWGKYKEIDYTASLHYDSNSDGKATGDIVDQYGYINEDVVITNKEFTRSGYTFEGWNTQADGKGKSYNEGNYTLHNEKNVLYAKWEANTNNLTVQHQYYNKLGNRDDAETSKNEVKTSYNSNIDEDKLDRPNYVFTEIEIDGGLSDTNFSDTKVTGLMPDYDVTITFIYKEDKIGEGEKQEDPDKIPDEYQVTFTYVSGEHGNVAGTTKEVITRQLDENGTYSKTNPATPKALVTATPDVGYQFKLWTSDRKSIGEQWSFSSASAIMHESFDGDTKFTANFVPNEGTDYNVEFYYQQAGQYPKTASSVIPRKGTTDKLATVTELDKEQPGYVYDISADNIESGTIQANGTLVLKLYFKQQFTVTYRPGICGSFAEQTYTGFYGAEMPAFTGSKTANGNYAFTGWDKEVAGKLTADAVYVAQWTYIGSRGGHDNDDGERGGSSKTPTGPGMPTTNIDPNAVPLANLPIDPTDGTTFQIEDSEVPLAGLPKTGNRGSGTQLPILFSGILMALYLALKNRKEDEQK